MDDFGKLKLIVLMILLCADLTDNLDDLDVCTFERDYIRWLF